MSNKHRIRVVLLALRHFGSIFSKHNTIDDQVLERLTAFDGSRDHHESVEPTAGLIETLSDEVCRESLVELFFTDAEGVVNLRERHRS